MKKIIALLLALIMVMGLATVASAAVDTSKWTSEASSTAISLKKVYTVTGATDSTLFPAETLKFTSTADTTNPDTTNLTISDLVVEGNTNQTITVNLPSYSKVGVYKYTIAETAGNTQGVNYTKGTLDITVLVEYDYTNSCLKATPSLTTGTASAKVDTFTNTYDVGSLTVSKAVTGNLGDKEKKFDITVTFTATQPVLSDISYTGDKTIPASEMEDGSASVVISLADGESVTFDNIPAGVTYTVVEADYTQGGKNSENGYDAAKYEFSDANKAIAKSDADTVKVTNNKETTVETGIAMDSVPFIVMAVVAVIGLAAFTAKKRVEE